MKVVARSQKRGNPQRGNAEGFGFNVKCEPNDMTKHTRSTDQNTHFGAPKWSCTVVPSVAMRPDSLASAGGVA